MHPCSSRGCKAVRGQSQRSGKIPDLLDKKVALNPKFRISYKSQFLTSHSFAAPSAARMHAISFQSYEQRPTAPSNYEIFAQNTPIHIILTQ